MNTFRQSSTGRKRRFTLVEMLVVIAIIGVLAALLMPTLSRALESARQASCANQQKQIATGITLYCNDNNQQFPAINIGADYFHNQNYKWYANLLAAGDYVGVKSGEWSNQAQGSMKKGIWRCPSLRDDQVGYGGGIAPGEVHSLMKYGVGSLRLTQLRRPSHLWLVGDVIKPDGKAHLFVTCSTCQTWENSWGASRVHNGGSNVAFADGHTEWREYYTLYYSYQNGDNVFAHAGKF